MSSPSIRSREIPEGAHREYVKQARQLSLVPIAFIVMTLAPAAAWAGGALPQGGAFVDGQGSITGDRHGLVITQPGSSRAVIDWRSFSIGRDNTVTFNNGAGATLNRVTGGSPSTILGRLTATGSLYLINPQGIVVGPGGVVTTGGRFVASTLGVSNNAFMNGEPLTLTGDSNTSIVNLGKISSSGGDVFLIAHRAVINKGSVRAPKGTSEFAVGERVLLQDSAGSRQVFVQTGSDGVVVNLGKVEAAQISLQAADGNIYALAGGGTRMRATGTAMRDGHVWLVADDGHVTQAGAIDAANADGTGGTVDTQASETSFRRGAVVHAGKWNISADSFTVDQNAALALVRSLDAGTSVGVATTGAHGRNGDIGIASAVSWQGSAALTFAAYHDVTIAPAATIKNTGNGNLTLRADALGIGNGGSIANSGQIDWSASTGTVRALFDMNGSYAPGTILGNAAWAAPPDSGLVTQVTGYRLVNSLADLQNVSADLEGNYALGKDVDASTAPGTTNTPIGVVVAPFSGQFDGMGHVISNLNVSASGTGSPPPGSYVAYGLFGVIGPTGVVRDLGVQGNVGGVGTYGGYGVLAGVNYGTIAGVRSDGVVNPHGLGSYASSSGGLVGWNYGTVTRSSSNAALNAEGPLGGLVGTNYDTGVIRQSYASGDVHAYGHTFGGGGLVGNNQGRIVQSFATGPVSLSSTTCGFSSTCGGGALVEANSGTIEQSFATGKVTQNLGPSGLPPAGIAGRNLGTIAGDVYWDKDTTGAAVGVGSGNPVPADNGLSAAQMSTPSSFGPTYDFGPNGAWAMPAGASHPVLRWQIAH